MFRPLSTPLVLNPTGVASVNGCEDADFYHPLTQSRIQCSAVCPPYLTTDVSIKYCARMCPDMYNCLLVKLPYYHSDDVGGISPEQQREIDEICPPALFYHGRFNQLAQCSDICKELEGFCEDNCPDYHECRMRHHEVIEKILTSSKDFVEVSTMPGGDPIITAQISPSQNSTEMFGLSSVALLSVIGVMVLIALLLLAYWWKRGKKRQVPLDKERGPEEQETNTVENSSVTGEDGVLPAAADVVDVNGSVLLEVNVNDAVPERTPFIAHPVDDAGGSVGYSLAIKPFDTTIEENDKAEALLHASKP